MNRGREDVLEGLEGNTGCLVNRFIFLNLSHVKYPHSLNRIYEGWLYFKTICLCPCILQQYRGDVTETLEDDQRITPNYRLPIDEAKGCCVHLVTDCKKELGSSLPNVFDHR